MYCYCYYCTDTVQKGEGVMMETKGPFRLMSKLEVMSAMPQILN